MNTDNWIDNLIQTLKTSYFDESHKHNIETEKIAKSRIKQEIVKTQLKLIGEFLEAERDNEAAGHKWSRSDFMKAFKDMEQILTDELKELEE